MPNSALEFLYNTSFDPPIPVMELNLLNPVTGSKVQAEFIIDSGADVTSISASLFDALDLEFSGSYLVSGVTGHEEYRNAAMLCVAVSGDVSRVIEVIVEHDFAENLIGRDLLNQWRVMLDGQRQRAIISIPG